MISFTSENAKKAAACLPRHPRMPFPFYIVTKPRALSQFFLGKWEQKHFQHRNFLTASTLEELLMWIDMQGIPRKHVFDATSDKDWDRVSQLVVEWKLSFLKDLAERHPKA